MRLGSFSDIITSMFKDRMTVYGYTSGTAANGSTCTVPDTTPKYVEEECKLSFPSDETPKNSDVDNIPLFATPKLFFRVSCRLSAGDHVIVTRVDDAQNVIATYEGTLGQPSTFISHQEALFLIKGSA